MGGKMLKEIENVPEMEGQVSDHTSNPTWAWEEHEKQGPFEAGRLMKYREFWLSIGQDEEVASWSLNGYEVHISEADERLLSSHGVFCRGLNKKNGKKAMENLDEVQVPKG